MGRVGQLPGVGVRVCGGPGATRARDNAGRARSSEPNSRDRSAENATAGSQKQGIHNPVSLVVLVAVLGTA